MSLKRDAARWRFTEQPGYFEIFSTCSYVWKVGIQCGNKSVNSSILGEHKKKGKAIDKAIKRFKSI